MYDSVNYDLIRDQLLADHTKISINNRAQLLDDAFNLASVNMVSFANALDLTRYLKNEIGYTPWNSILPNMDFIYKMFVNNNAIGESWNGYMKTLVEPYFNSIGFNESPDDSYPIINSRSNAINWACRLGVSGCIQDVSVAYASWMDSPFNEEVISRHQKDTILAAAIEYCSETDWESAYQRFLNPLDPSERNSIRGYLGRTRIESIQNRLLEYMLIFPAGVDGNDGIQFFNTLAYNPYSNNLAFAFLRDNWDELEQIYTSIMPGFLRTVSTNYNTVEQLDELKSIGELHNLGLNGNFLAAISAVQENIRWMETNADVISNWLQQQIK